MLYTIVDGIAHVVTDRISTPVASYTTRSHLSTLFVTPTLPLPMDSRTLRTRLRSNHPWITLYTITISADLRSISASAQFAARSLTVPRNSPCFSSLKIICTSHSLLSLPYINFRMLMGLRPIGILQFLPRANRPRSGTIAYRIL